MDAQVGVFTSVRILMLLLPSSSLSSPATGLRTSLLKNQYAHLAADDVEVKKGNEALEMRPRTAGYISSTDFGQQCRASMTIRHNLQQPGVGRRSISLPLLITATLPPSFEATSRRSSF